MWAPDKCTALPPKMDSRYTSTAGIGDLNQLSAAIPATRVEVSVSCRNLLDRDTFSKSDPICVLYVQGAGNKEWREFGRTEVIDNTLNPDFVRKFILDYFFEERENLRFDLYDVDSKSPNLSKHNELSDTRAKFHVLFLFFVSAMFFISVLSLFSYHCWLVGKNRTTIESFRAPTFSYGPDGNGFSLGYSKNWREVFGDEKKYWLIPVFSSLGDGCSFPARLVGMDPEQASVTSQNEYARSIGSNQPFPIKPLSESKNRLLDSESQWTEIRSEEGIVRSGTNNHVTVTVEN